MRTQKIKSNYQIKNLLSSGDSNAKTSKNQFKTFILYLVPEELNDKGVNLCPNASEGCKAACLFTAGRGVMKPVKAGRLNKANYFVYERENFLEQLASEILKQYAKAKRLGYRVYFRLNGTSDVDFYTLLKRYAQLDVESLSDAATFYEYTKTLAYIKRHQRAANIVYTFSRSEVNSSLLPAALALGANIAAVFSGELPETYLGAPVVDGDESDLVMLDHSSTIIGLKAKGKARKDDSGFVIKTY